MAGKQVEVKGEQMVFRCTPEYGCPASGLADLKGMEFSNVRATRANLLILYLKLLTAKLKAYFSSD